MTELSSGVCAGCLGHLHAADVCASQLGHGAPGRRSDAADAGHRPAAHAAQESCACCVKAAPLTDAAGHACSTGYSGSSRHCCDPILMRQRCSSSAVQAQAWHARLMQ